MDKEQKIELKIDKEKPTNYNESFEATLNNIYAMAILLHRIYARLGYQIKIQEQILAKLSEK